MTEDVTRGHDADETFDVVICGGGLAGLLLARQLHREHAELSIAVVERTPRPLPDACHKVGESSVEVGSQYLESLGLTEYLRERHLVKLGLRFFPGGGEHPLEERTEIGPCAEPIVRSYQLDRGRLEEDLRGMLERDGVTLQEGARVRDIALGPDEVPHLVTVADGDDERRLACRWVVDATGRAALLRRRLKLTRGTRHAASAAWLRITGRLDINDLVPPEDEEFRSRACANERWRSTNHLMGAGYWAWIIPLSTGHTSVGVVVHEETHEFHSISSLERLRAFLAEHEPVLDQALDTAEVRDFLCLKGYSHAISRCWSKDRWAIVGEAGAFVDPLYSPGSDFIAFANQFTVEMMRADRDGRDLDERARLLNTQYKALVAGAVDIFRHAAPVYGHARAMAAKIYWDNFAYWSFTAQYYQQQIYRVPSAEHAAFADVGRTFLELTSRMQTLFRTWAELDPQTAPTRRFLPIPAFPSVLVDTHVALEERWTVAETLASMRERAEQGREIAGELVLRAVLALGRERGSELLERLEFDGWGIELPAERLAAERLGGLARRRHLSPLSRDVERTLGRVPSGDAADDALDLFVQGSPA